MKKNTIISILTCFIFIFTFSLETHASEDIIPVGIISSEHTAGVVTGYTGSTVGQGGTLFKNEQYHTVAVHQISKTNTDPIFPFGTSILTKNALYVNGYGNKTLFKVTDTGDLNRVRDLYWFDVYFGTSTSTNQANAKEFGVKNKNVDYTAY